MKIDLDIDIFDPGNLARLYAQDFIGEVYGSWPEIPPGLYSLPSILLAFDADEAGQKATMRAATTMLTYRGDGWTADGCEWSDSELAQKLIDLGNAVRLPFHPHFIELMENALYAWRHEARTRLRKREKQRRDAERYGASHWSQSDFLAEVQAIAGEGRQKGKQWWFVCPWHNDRNPSLEVDPVNKLWKCWSCGESGGVVAWRKMGEKVGRTS